MRIDSFFAVGICLFLMVAESEAEITVMAGLNEFGLGFTFQSVPSPSSNDAATDAQFRLVDGLRDTNGGDLAVLHDESPPTKISRQRTSSLLRVLRGAGFSWIWARRFP